MTSTPILREYFYHDGRGPELQKVLWGKGGIGLIGFEYFNPDDEYIPANLKHVRLNNVQAYFMATEEVHGDIVVYGNANAAIVRIDESKWKASFLQSHLRNCHHYQFMFYDEIFDVICEDVVFGYGALDA